MELKRNLELDRVDESAVVLIGHCEEGSGCDRVGVTHDAHSVFRADVGHEGRLRSRVLGEGEVGLAQTNAQRPRVEASTSSGVVGGNDWLNLLVKKESVEGACSVGEGATKQAEGTEGSGGETRDSRFVDMGESEAQTKATHGQVQPRLGGSDGVQLAPPEDVRQCTKHALVEPL